MMIIDIFVKGSLIAFVLSTAFSLRTILKRIKKLEGEVAFLNFIVEDLFIDNLKRKSEEKVEKDK